MPNTGKLTCDSHDVKGLHIANINLKQEQTKAWVRLEEIKLNQEMRIFFFVFSSSYGILDPYSFRIVEHGKISGVFFYDYD